MIIQLVPEESLKENNFDIVTFLTKKIDFKIQGYDTIKDDHSTGARDGVVFLVKHGLVINKEYCDTDFSIITPQTKTRNPSLLMTLLYGLPVKMYNLQQKFCIRTYENWQSGVPNGE